MTRTYKTISEAMSAVGAKEYRTTSRSVGKDQAGQLLRFDHTTRKFEPVAGYSMVDGNVTVYDLPSVPDKVEPNHLFD